MHKPFRIAPLDLLARWVFEDLDRGATVLGIPQANFEVPDRRMATIHHGNVLAAPLGVAAGPHTQLSQNIVASWLCGARFIELKTVQVLDEIDVARPCIDAEDETYNCEWSQELRLDESFTEYLNAWVLVHAAAHRLGLAGPGVVFNMSVGYDLAGIVGDKVQRFLARMRDASDELPAAIDAVAEVYPAVKDIHIPARLSDHITLSTMHGCPPSEIARIASYLLGEHGVHTWVKLNPTLLGPDALRGMLNDRFGWDIEVPDEAFAHDPQFPDAMAMVRQLAQTAREAGRCFGIKLSNTLEVVNRRPVFPQTEKMMYLSGRALHPITLTLAHRVTDELDGEVPISFCGGADANNFPDLVADGLAPVTVCTDLLKPGGYARLQQYLMNLEQAMDRVGAESIDDFITAPAHGRPGGAWENLVAHAARVSEDSRYQARERPMSFKGERPLGPFDCIAAPCQEACPSHQNIPDYLWHVSQGQFDEAFDVVLRTNAMPAVTGQVCDHKCTERCVRQHYDAPLAIREVKRFVVEAGHPRERTVGEQQDAKVAIIGAGPAGLAAAYFLGQAGFPVTLFEARQDLGGMVSGVIPAYRLAAQALASDVERIRALGVEVRLGERIGPERSLADLRRDGFSYVFLAVGAQKGKMLGIPGEDAAGVLDALDFLDRVGRGEPPPIGPRVVVIGGGNSAMDAARTARRLLPDGEVQIVYRRTRAQMPAEPEEIEACLEEGIGLRDLLAPQRVIAAAGMVTALGCQQMRLGEPDASGRPRPVPVDWAELEVPCDTVIAAISQEPVLDFLGDAPVERKRNGTLQVDPDTGETSVPGLFAGGDVVHGPSSVIQAIADGRRVAEAIAGRHGVMAAVEPKLDKHLVFEEALERKARRAPPQTVPTLPASRRSGFDEVIQTFSAEAASLESERCLDCDEVCSLCVTVCPNRANQPYRTGELHLELPVLELRDGLLQPLERTMFHLEQSVQVANIADFCNECGNCTPFCPAAGAPYKDKPRLWLSAEGFAESKGDAFHLRRQNGTVRLEARLDGERHLLVAQGEVAEYQTERVRARWRVGSWELEAAEPGPGLGEGACVDLSPCGTMIALLGAASMLPAHPI